MSRKSYLEQACEAVPEFKTESEQFLRKYTIAGKSDFCTRNYLMQISKLVLHFKCSPLDLSQDQLEEYLFYIRRQEKPSLSSFKHLVYGLRTMFSMFKNERLYLSLPSISKSKTLPEVFSQEEIRNILKTPKLLKHRVLFAVIYDCGLRISEVINLKISDVDFDRLQLHIRESKCKKDRYVPLSELTSEPWIACIFLVLNLVKLAGVALPRLMVNTVMNFSATGILVWLISTVGQIKNPMINTFEIIKSEKLNLKIAA